MSLAGYPPPEHVLSDLGIEAEVTSETTARVRTRVTPYIAGADGGVRAGVLATLVDIVGGAVAVRALRPDWMATADLTVQLVRPATGPWVEARGEVVRKGRTTLVIEATVVNVLADGIDLPGSGDEPDPVALATMTFAILPGRSPTSSLDVSELPSRWAFTGTGFDRSVVDALGMAVVDPGVGRVSLPVHQYSFNSFGAVQGGVMALLGDVAGEALLGAVSGSVGPCVVTDLQVAYLALGRVGPIVTSATALETAGPGGRMSAAVELRDEGAGGRLTTVITVGAVPAGVAAGAVG